MTRTIDVGGLSQFYTGWTELSPTESRITDPEMKYYDYYPMEELTGR